MSSFLTTCSVFIPLTFIKGNIGSVLLVIPLTLLLVLAVSLIEAFLILPSHLAHAVDKVRSRPPNRWRTGFDRGLAWLRERVVGRAVDVAINWR